MAHVANKAGMASGMMQMGPGMMGKGGEMMKMSPDMMKGMMGSGMMKDMMGPGMMSMGSDMMRGMMGSGMGKEAARGAANIVVVTAGPGVSQSVLGRLIRHPVVLLGIGITAGILIYKYRKQIISDKND